MGFETPYATPVNFNNNILDRVPMGFETVSGAVDISPETIF